MCGVWICILIYGDYYDLFVMGMEEVFYINAVYAKTLITVLSRNYIPKSLNSVAC